MKTSEILIEAKRELATSDKWSSGSRYLCFAITGQHETKGDKVVRRIEEAIGMGEHISVRDWLVKHGHATREQCTHENLQDYRHRWIDSLIAGYQEAGD